MTKTGVLPAVETREKARGMRRKTVFVATYLMVLTAFFGLTFLLFKMPIVSHLALTASRNTLMIPIVLIFLICLVMSLVTFANTLKESSVVEDLVENQSKVDLLKTDLPTEKAYVDSLFINHFRKFSTAENNHWSEEAKSSLESYMEEMIFRGPNWIKFLENMLPILGLVGTALGLAETCIDKAASASMFAGIANAIGTTVFALYGKLTISSLNQTVISERNSLLKTALVIFRITEKRR